MNRQIISASDMDNDGDIDLLVESKFTKAVYHLFNANGDGEERVRGCDAVGKKS